jgi:hypothetical protein
MWEHFIIMAAVAAVKAFIKNPAKAAAAREYLLELRNDINALYPDDAPTPSSAK